MIAAANLNHGKYQRIDRSPSTETDECLSCEPYVSDRYLTCPLLLSSSLFFPRVWGLDPRYLTCPLIPVRRNSSRLLGVGSALIHFPVGGGMVQIDWRCIALRDLVRRSPRRPAKIAISSPTAESEIPTAGHLRNKSERSGQNGIKNSETVTSPCSRLVTSRYLAPSLVRGPDI